MLHVLEPWLKGVLMFFFWSFSIWKQGQNCDCDGVCQPRGPVWLHLRQEEHLWAGGQALLQTNCISCTLLPSGKAVFLNPVLSYRTYKVVYRKTKNWSYSYGRVSYTSLRMAATSNLMAQQSSTKTSCSAGAVFPGHWHPQSYIMGTIHCQPANLNREAVRTMQGELNIRSVESQRQG